MSLKDWFQEVFAPQDVIYDGQADDHFSLPASPIPRLASVRSAPARDEFAAWLADPTTQFVLAALRRNAEECREQWLAISWGSGKADQRALDGLRERADALLGFTAGYDAFCETLGLEPEPEEE